jgi:hypothetical protein
VKRVFVKDMDWETIQREYNDGMSCRGIMQHFSISGKAVANAVKLGLLKTRTGSESVKLKLQQAPRDYSKYRATKTALTNYRADCKFKFNLADYPDEFNFQLVTEHGWYSPKNRGNNIYGVSRDHMLSVRYGFDNSIDPKILAHPANCRLMLQSDNVSKLSKCSITLEDLLIKIAEWDKRYLGYLGD